METRLDERDLADVLSEVIDRVRGGDRFVVTRDGAPVAVLVSADRPEPPGVSGRELARRIGDLAMPGDGFMDDVEAARQRLRHPMPPTWPD